MIDYPVPLERLRYFQEKVGLTPADLALVARHRQTLAAQHERFGAHFYDYFSRIPRTSLILEHEQTPRNLERVLGRWFERLFSDGLGEGFIQYLWDSGLRHVEVSLDQRYVNLGYTIARQFCQGVLAELIPPEDRQALGAAIDKLLDFCVLVATDSFISVTSRCDRQVIEGIAHQVRNPVMVIGGNIKRLQNQVDRSTPTFRAYQAVLEENRRLERMVRDVGVYNQLFQGDPSPQAVDLGPLLAVVLEELAARGHEAARDVRLDLDPGYRVVLADPGDLATMFRHLLENCLEAMDPADPRVEVSTRPSPRQGYLEVRLHNTGQAPSPEEVEGLFNPFHSTKPTGTGFGLPIASLVARRNLGGIELSAAPQGGTLCLVRLPLPGPAPTAAKG